jgi:RHS repeat-associated protein
MSRTTFTKRNARRNRLLVSAVGATLISAFLVAASPGVAHAAGGPTVLGDLSYQKYQTQSLTNRAGLSVNVADGNVLLQSEDLNVNGTGPALSVERSFNDQGTGSGQAGNRDTLSVGADVHITGNGNGSATFQGPSGFQVTYPSNGSGGYTIPAAYNGAALATVSGGGWTLTYQSGEVFTFNSAGNETKDASANGEAVTYAYNTNGTLASATDTQGRVTSFSNYTGTDVGLITDSSGRTVTYSYTSGNLTGVTDGAGNTWQFQYYDGHGNLNQITDPRGYTTTLAYNSSGQVTSIIYDNYTNASTTWTYTYNNGNTVITDPLGHTTTYYYDNSGRVTNVLNAVGDYFGSSYNASNDQTASESPSGESTTLTYDANNDLLSVQNPGTAAGNAGAMASYTYNSTTHPYLPSGGTDTQGNLVSYSYDTNGNLTSSSSMSAGGTGMGTATQTIQGDPASGGGTTNCGAQPGEVCTSTDANGNVTSYGYDTKGNAVSVTPPGPVGREIIAYDSLSRPTKITNGNGQSETITYNGNDQPLVVTYSDGSTVQYSYDADGNLTQRNDAAGTTQWTYDGFNQITQITQTGQPTLTYTYDAAGNLHTEAGPAGTITYTYTNANEIAGVNQSEDNANETFVFQNGRPAIIYVPGNITETIGYDNAGRETSITAVRTNSNNTSTTLTSYSGSYATASGVDSAVLQSETNNLTGVTTTYGYDGVNRLTSANATGTGANSYTYTYDKNGNRTQYSHNGAYSAVFGYNAANELTTSGGATDGTYDQAGNQTSTGAGLTLGYNPKNQTTSFTPPGKSTIAETYTDGDQNGRTVNGATTEENGVLGVYSDTTAGTATYYTHLPTGTHQVLGETTGTSTYYYLTDLQGSTVDVTDGYGNVKDTYTYDPYGNTITTTGNTPNPWQYAGGYYDAATGLYKFGARYYNPADARWTQLDPAGQSFGYLYAGDNPINEVDPTGTCSVYTAGVCVVPSLGGLLQPFEAFGKTAVNPDSALGGGDDGCVAAVTVGAALATVGDEEVEPVALGDCAKGGLGGTLINLGRQLVEDA